MADDCDKAVKPSLVGWALRGAVGFAIVTCVVALLLAAYLSGDASERFATTAYLAAVFAAVALAITQFVPGTDRQERPARSMPAFPTLLGSALGILVFISVVAALVSQPGGELIALVAGFGLVVLAALVRRGTFGPLNARLAALRPRSLRVAATHGLAASFGALAVAPLLPDDAAGIAAAFGYRLFFVAALLLLWSLLAPTNAGAFARERYARAIGYVDRLARDLLFERLATYAAALAAVAFVAASLLRGAFAEPLATIGYLASIACAIGVAMECRRLRA
ncbi:MAG: hypothetical protein WBE77_01815 [Candidatus Cybelea sp.]